MSTLTKFQILWNVLTDGEVFRELIHDATRYNKDDARDTARAVLLALFVQLPAGIFSLVLVVHLIWREIMP
jgi:hypothetical protein